MNVRQPAGMVVIGASLAGLFAAAAGAAAGHRVVLLDRDELDADTLAHPGVPHGRQPHVFLLRALDAAEDLLPGLGADLRARGAVEFDGARLAWLGEDGWAPVRSSGRAGLTMSRQLFEQAVRRRVLALPEVRLESGRSVTGLQRSDPPVAPWRVLTPAGEFPADVVVDASGRGSRLPAWLTALGVFADPADVPTQQVDARIGYSVREYTNVPDLDGVSGIVVSSTPETGRGGLALPLEGGRWQVLASGSGANRPPRDVDGYEAALRALRDPALADLAARSTPVGDVLIYRRTGNRRRRYETCRTWPAGLLAVGDSLVSLNPVFGQGIAVAAIQALVLRDGLSHGRLTVKGTRSLQRRLARKAVLPWAIAVGQDLRYPTTDGDQNRAQKLTSDWVRELRRLASSGNDRAHLTVVGLFNMVVSPAALLHPALVAGVIGHRLRGRTSTVARPAALDVLSLVIDETPAAPSAAVGTVPPASNSGSGPAVKPAVVAPRAAGSAGAA